MIIAEHLSRIGYRPRGIVHCGAHYAEEMADYLALGPNVIVWIEADAAHLDTLRSVAAAAAGSARQHVVHALIADLDGAETQFFRFSNEGASSSVFRALPRLAAEWPDVVETGEVLTLTSSRLDSVLAQLGVVEAATDVLVFDLQGAELMALRGAGSYLDAAQYVEVEVSAEAIYAGGPLAGELDAFLEGAGFRRVTDLPWHGDAVYERCTFNDQRGCGG